MAAEVLPPELHKNIISHLRDDPPALLACSLTCREWLDQAHSHLFRSVVLADTMALIRFGNILESPSAKATIGCHVRELSFSLSSSHPALVIMNNSYLSRILPKLDKVEHMTIRDLTWTGPNEEVIGPARALQQSLLTFSPNITSLTFIGVKVKRRSDLVRFFVAFPRLSAVRLSFREEENNFHLQLEKEWPTIHLRELLVQDHASGESGATLVDCFPEPPFELRLEKLGWSSYPTTRQYEGLSKLLQGAGTSLRDLWIHFWHKSAPGELPPYVNLTSNTQLARLHFLRMLVIPGFNHSWVPSLLEQVRPDGIQLVEFSFFSIHYKDNLDFWDWKQMDEILSQFAQKGPRLRVVFHFINGTLGDTVWSPEATSNLTVGDRLPKLVGETTTDLDVSIQNFELHNEHSFPIDWF